MIKAIFLDIDGTLVSFRTHRVPQSALEAIREVRRQGVKVFIATGRPRPFINNVEEVGCDGIISVNGACVTLADGTHLAHELIPRADIRRMVEHQRTENIPVVYASATDAFVSHLDDRVRGVFTHLDIPLPAVRPAETALDMDVMQLIAFFTTEQESGIMADTLQGCAAVRWHPHFADCVRRGTDKASGVDSVLRHYGLDLSEAMAFGDGGNDIGMLSHVGWGVAMGNASEAVKAAARIVTASVDEDGIAQVLRRLPEWA